MGKMKLSSTNTSRSTEIPEEFVVVPEYHEVTVPKYIETEKIITVEVPKPVTKEVLVEIPKPTYKIVEVEETVQKPRIKVEEVTQSVIKPVFSIKTETIVLDQIQKKLDESLSLTSAKLEKLNSFVVQQPTESKVSIEELETLKRELKLIKTLVALSVLSGLAAVVVSLLG